MFRSIAIAITLLMLAAAPAAAQSEPQEFECGRHGKDAENPKLIADPSLHILEQTQLDNFTLPPPPSGETAPVYYCIRSDAVPAPNDWKVLLAQPPTIVREKVLGVDVPVRVPFTIFPKERGGFLRLDMFGDVLAIQLINLSLTDEERARARTFLKTAQELLNQKQKSTPR